MSSSAAQYRNEKKRMEDAVARVREVVHAASKNDIILALHNFDLDVNRTIQAFCDDGAQSALGSWEQMGSGGHKKKTQKKKKGGSIPASDSVSAKQQPHPTTANGHVNNGDARSSKFVENGVVKTETVPASAPSSNSVRPSSVKQKAPLAPPPNQPHTSRIADLHTQQHNTDKVLSTEISNLKGHGKEIEKIETAFNGEIALAEDNIRTVFKDVRQLLADRESHILAELKRAHDDGARVLTERRVQAGELYNRGLRIGAMSEREQAEFGEEMTSFRSFGEQEREIGHATRFLYDNAQLIKIVKNFGQVVGVKTMTAATAPRAVDNNTAQQPIKHSTSHSSINSSLGEDSGLGHISPVTNGKPLVAVSNGGINMMSDALSADELVNLNKKLQETLKAQGIDASVISGISCGTMPARRRPAGHRGGTGRGANNSGAPRRNGPQASAGARMPKLSILQS